MPKDGVRAGVLSLAQLMKGGFDVGVGLHRTKGDAMGSRRLPAPGQWRGQLLNCVGGPMATDGGKQVGMRINVGHGKQGRWESRDEGRGSISGGQNRGDGGRKLEKMGRGEDMANSVGVAVVGKKGPRRPRRKQALNEP